MLMIAGIPNFQETSNPSLNDVLSTMRSKHFVPGYLDRSTRHLIFGTKHRQSLLDNPQTVTIGDEEVPLVWMNRETEIPNRTKLLKEAVDLMEQGEKKDWQNLRPLLTGLGHFNVVPKPEMMERIVRRAVNAGQVGVVLGCLDQSKATGMTLKHDGVLTTVVRGVREQAQRAGWSEDACKTALGHARKLALLLESEEHGTGRRLREKDPRQRPEVIGVFLELAAVNAYLHNNKQDAGDTVRVYTSRLLSIIGPQTQPQSFAPPVSGPANEMLDGVPLWHGLQLAEKMLGERCPNKQQVSKIVADYGAGLKNLAESIDAKQPKEGSYGAQAVRVWKDCIRD